MHVVDRPPAQRGRSAIVGAWAALAVVASAALAGCTSSTPEEATTTARSIAESTAATTTVGTLTSASVITVKTTAPPTTVTAGSTSGPAPVTGPPPATREPAPVAGECPYLSTADLELINGQRAGGTTVIDVEPQPICDFYRSDGGWQARIRIVEAATPEEAVAAVDQHIPVADSAPASRPAGWSGGSMVTPDGIAGNPEVRSVYAVAKGTFAIIAESNQEQTIKGRQMVIKAVENLGL